MVIGKALPVLNANRGTWYCLPCWAEAARVTSPEHYPILSLLAKKPRAGYSLALMSDPEAPSCGARGRTCESGQAHPGWGFVVRAKPSN